MTKSSDRAKICKEKKIVELIFFCYKIGQFFLSVHEFGLKSKPEP